MGVQDYISEAEALSLTGISAKTLARFVEAGYLQKEEDNDGIPLFSKREISDLFMAERLTQQTQSSDSYNPWKGAPKSAPTPLESAVQVSGSTTAQRVEQTSIAAEVVEPSALVEEVQDTSASFTSTPFTSTQTHTEENTSTPSALEKSYALFSQSSEEQLNKLHRIITLQEKLLDAREDEIKDLKEQRNWLRSRIEKLEEKSDKDQLILLSETQVIRKLVIAQQQKRSPIRAALEWLGIVEGKNSIMHPTMIEMSNTNQPKHH